MTPPSEITAAKAWPRMGEEHREYFTERAGILQHCGGLSIDAAERVALLHTRRHFRSILKEAA